MTHDTCPLGCADARRQEYRCRACKAHRYRIMLRMRANGFSFTQIGHRLGVTRQAIYQYLKYKKTA